ncbi:amidohydrolase [Streptomyces sp. CBMA123]|uniref:amidohydrolase n=1 Tax=Streptomyces sp. CBMA123 TaxID=1896313 RepID=UPI001661BFA1|nr:amidohydrolase [Streptomyces sp. CBMA123]MBD0688217.1 amidohydrolase [Streptomyces sp. CBMA123]
MTSMPVAGLRPGLGDDRADLVVRNARIHTGDRRRPTASALTVHGGRIGVVGDDRDVAPYLGPDTVVVDAQYRRVVPGLNDSHCHVVRGGLHFVLELRWDGVPSLAVGLRMLREQAARTPAGQWVRVAGGWSVETVAEHRLPSPAELNAAAPDTPVIITHLYQSAVLNRAALRAAGITRDSPNPAGGQIVRGHDGEPTGMLIAAPAAGLLYATIAKAPVLNPALQKASTAHFLRELNRFGLTSLVDGAGGFQDFPSGYTAVTELAAAQELTVRIAYHLFPQTLGQEVEDLRRWATLVKPGDGDEWLRFNGAGENLVWAATDFENFAQPRPELGPYEDQLEQAVRVLLENGWGFRLHATYDETIRRDLAVFEKLAAEGLFPGPGRWLFDHAETVSPQSLDRIAALGGSLGVQHRLAYQGETFARRYGAAAAAAAPPLGAMLERGLHVAAGTDATRVSTYNPWVALHWLVSGRTVGGLRTRSAAHCVSRETALEMYTAAGARLTGEQEVKGRLSPGFLADLAILTDDYFTVPEQDIPLIEAALTVVGGRIVHAVGEFEGLAVPAPPVEPGWSPLAHFGGYQAGLRRVGDGARQAELLGQAAADSTEQLRRSGRRGAGTEADAVLRVSDPCFE